jgi:Grx4 family monothiol glutaredoxin
MLLVQGRTVLETLTGPDAKVISSTLQSCLVRLGPGAPSSAPSASVTSVAREAARTRARELTLSAHAMLFMKGSPDAPMCKYSRSVTELLRATGLPFSTFDVLKEEPVRFAIKEYGGYQTYPQLWVGGVLVGGHEELSALSSSGHLAEMLAPKGLGEEKPAVMTLEERCVGLVNSAPVMLFMKGNPDAPRCGFSARIVDLLRSQQITFSTFDILSDPDVRQGLKEYCGKWPTFPQLFVKGQFIGGLDIVKEMAEEGGAPLSEQLGLNE